MSSHVVYHVVCCTVMILVVRVLFNVSRLQGYDNLADVFAGEQGHERIVHGFELFKFVFSILKFTLRKRKRNIC